MPLHSHPRSLARCPDEETHHRKSARRPRPRTAVAEFLHARFSAQRDRQSVRHAEHSGRSGSGNRRRHALVRRNPRTAATTVRPRRDQIGVSLMQRQSVRQRARSQLRAQRNQLWRAYLGSAQRSRPQRRNGVRRRSELRRLPLHGGDWRAIAWWIHDHLPYSVAEFYPKLGAFNISWHERPQRRIDSYSHRKAR